MKFSNQLKQTMGHHKAVLILVTLLLSACTDSTKLENTPLALKEINEIGELITAEYYGEVIRSLISISKEDMRMELEQDLKNLKNVYKNLESTARNENATYRRFKKEAYDADYRFKRLLEITDLKKRNLVEDVIKTMTWETFRTIYW
jgi:chaperonin cofactor prefoldin